jgi:hypothetical protein
MPEDWLGGAIFASLDENQFFHAATLQNSTY